MGSTLTALQSGGGQFLWVVAIEGYDTLLTSRDDLTSEVLTAWAGTPWATSAKCLGGLSVRASFEQELQPWEAQPTPRELQLIVRPDSTADTFGTLVHATGAGNEAYQSASIDANDTSISGVTFDDFSATGTAYLGVETVTYTGNDGSSLTGLTRGMYSPFNRASETDHKMGRSHAVPQLATDTWLSPLVTDAPRAWIGKYVGVWLHRVLGTTVDTKANAQLVFAGTIEAIEDSFGDDGGSITVVSCVDLVEKLNRTTLLNDQYKGTIEPGFPIYGGPNKWTVIEMYWTGAGGDFTVNNGGSALVPTSPAVDEYDIEPGYYSIDALLNALNTWLAKVTSDGNIDGTYSLGYDADNNACFVTGDWQSSTANLVIDGPGEIIQALGWDGHRIHVDGGEDDRKYYAPNNLRYDAGLIFGGGISVNVNNETGTLFNNLDWLPPELYDKTDETGVWAVLQVQGALILGKANSAASPSPFTNVHYAWEFTDGQVDDSVTAGMEIRQVAMLSGRALNVIAEMFCSTGIADGAYNSGYDYLPAQLGAGIPWEVLGNNFVNTLANLTGTLSDPYIAVIEKPTRIWDVIGTDMLLRGANLIWKNGGYQWTTIQTPSSATSSHTLTANTKATASSADKMLAVARTDDSIMRNVVKVEYAQQRIGGGYTKTTFIRHARSISDHGATRAHTFEMNNSYSAHDFDTTTIVEQLCLEFASRVMPWLGLPVQRMRVPVSLAYFENVAPGDVVLITDAHCRSPLTGARTITAKPGLIVRHSCSFGGDGSDMVGEVDVILFPQDRVSIYSPSSKLASWDGSELTLTAHEYSESTESVDALHWDSGDAILIVERDPSNPAAPDYLETEVDDVADAASNIITITGDADDLTEDDYHIMSDSYTDADIQATQQQDVYTADSDDMQIADAAAPYLYGEAASTVSASAADPTDLCERHATMCYGDGLPASVHLTAMAARNVNNLVGYSTAPHGPVLFDALHIENTNSDWYYLTHFPLWTGTRWRSAYTRQWTVAPLFRSDTAATAVYVRVTFSLNPPVGDSRVDTSWPGPYTTLTEWTSTSTTFATGTAQECPAISDAWGKGYLTIEVKSTGAAQIELWGLSKLWLGPLEGI